MYADDDEVVGVATPGVYIGQPLSSASHRFRVPTLRVLWGGNMFRCDIGKPQNGSAGRLNSIVFSLTQGILAAVAQSRSNPRRQDWKHSQREKA